MDKQLLAALDNLSEALYQISDALGKKDAKSATGDALQSGEFGKQIQEIHSGIISLKEDTAKILDNQETILKILNSKKKEEPKKLTKVPKGETSVEVGKEKEKDEKEEEKKKKGLGFDTSKIKEGVGTLILMAAGIVAIGLALKIVGNVNFVSVLALALALPLIAIAFERIAKIDVDPKKIPSLILMMVVFSTAITLSSYILSMVKPVGLSQLATSIFIAGTFAVISLSLGKLLSAFGNINLIGAAKAVLFMPLILVGVSTAIALSSQVLSFVNPISFSQATTAILISGAFSVMAFGLGKLVAGFNKINPIEALTAAKFIPQLLVAVSLAIVGASLAFQFIQPIGFIQAITAILIAGVFTVLAFGIGKIISAFKGVDPVAAFSAAAIMPVIFIALSGAIAVSSWILSMIVPIGIFQALTAILIAATFVILSFGLSKIIPAFKGLDKGDVMKASFGIPLIFTAMSLAIMLSSHLFAEIKPIGIGQFLTAVGISVVFVGLALVTGKIVKGVRNLDYKDVIKTGGIMLIMVTSIVAAGFIISIMPDIPLSKLLSFVELSLSIGLTTIAIAGTIWVLNKMGMNVGNVAKGAVVILALALTIALTSLILSIGNYESGKYPDISWVLGVGSSLLAFGLGAFVLGAAVFGPQALVFAAGLVAILAVAASIMATSHILSFGKYEDGKYPDTSWILGVGSTLVTFAIGAVVLGVLAIPALIGLLVVDKIANSIVSVANILSSGNYDKYPSASWIAGVGTSLLGFTAAIIGMSIIGAVSGIVSLIPGVKDPIDIGISTVNKIANAIVGVDQILSKGSFSSYPKLEWALSVGGIMTAFVGAIIAMSVINGIGGIVEFFGGTNPIDSGIEGVKKIAQSIVDVSSILSKGNYKGGPNETWSKGIGLAISSFTPVFEVLANSKSIFSSGPSISEMKDAITTISEAIVEAAVFFSKNKSSFDNPPPEEWARGVGKAIAAFSPIYEVLANSKGIFSSGPSVGEMKRAIITISNSIIEAASIFGTNVAVFDPSKAPNVDWSKGVSSAISAFAPVFEYLSENSGWFGADVDDLNEAIVTIAYSIVSVSNILKNGDYSYEISADWIKSIDTLYNNYTNMIGKVSKIEDEIETGGALITTIAFAILRIDYILSRGKYSKFPNNKWIDSSNSVILKFADLLVKINDEYPVESLVGGVRKTIVILSLISRIDRTFQKGIFKKYPSKNWVNSSNSVILKFANLLIKINDEYSFDSLNGGFTKTVMILSLISIIDRTFERGKYGKYPEKNWIDNSKSSVEEIAQLAAYINSEYSVLDLWLGLRKVRNIADTIQYVSLSLNKGNYSKYPSVDWAKGSALAINEFMNFSFSNMFTGIFSSIFGSDDEDKKAELGKIVDLMLYVDEKFQEGNWNKFPTVAWAEGTIMAIQKFRSVINMLSFGSMGDKVLSFFGAKDPLKEAVSNIELLAKSFDKLGKSFQTFSNSLEGLDAEKLAAIKTLSSNVVLMSLMDPDQFDKMMTALEERSGVFGDLIKDIDANRRESGGSVVSVKPTSTSSAPDNTKILADKLDNMTALLANISGVVGGDLKRYLQSIKNDVSIGGSNAPVQKSDKRYKNIIRNIGKSDSGINIYLYTYIFDNTQVYQGVIAQELLDTKWQDALLVDANGFYSVDYSKIDVEFKKTTI